MTPRMQAIKDLLDDLDDLDDDELCSYIHGYGNGHVCGLLADHNVHHLQSALGFHYFDAGKPAAPTASDSSSANGGGGNSTANVETSTATATSTAGGE